MKRVRNVMFVFLVVLSAATLNAQVHWFYGDPTCDTGTTSLHGMADDPNYNCNGDDPNIDCVDACGGCYGRTNVVSVAVESCEVDIFGVLTMSCHCTLGGG